MNRLKFDSGECSTTHVWMAVLPAVALGQWTTGTGGTIYYNGGNVGVGTNNPQYLLDLNGTLRVGNAASSSLYFGSSGVLTSDTGATPHAVMSAGAHNNTAGSWIADAAAASMMANFNGNLYFGADTGLTAGAAYSPSYRMFVQGSTGYVGIGTTNPPYKLSVEGNIGARDIIVTNTPWSDYVFKPGYRLRPLSEVGAYIRQHRHLPDIPTEAEVREKGVSVGEMQAKLLGKVEELTLHLIEQEKENTELRQRVLLLEKRAGAVEQGR